MRRDSKNNQKKLNKLHKDIDDLDKENQTLAENNRTYIELHKEQKQEIDESTKKMKKINDERNHLEESLEAANEKIGAFIQQITHNEELMAVMNREQTKLRTRLAKAERVNDQLETKKESDSKLLETEKLKSRDIERSLNKMIETEKI